MQTDKNDERGGTPAKGVSHAPGARNALILLLSINLFNYIDRQVLAAVVPYIRQEFFEGGEPASPFVQFLLGLFGRFLGANPENAMIGLLAMVFMVTYMVTAPVFGILRLRRWWVVAGGVALWSLASGASGLASTFAILLFTRCLVGIGEAAYGPVAPTMIADLYPESVRGRMLSWFYLAIPVGSALGFVIGGLVAAWLGWRWAFYLVVPPGILLAAIALFMREPARGGADGAVVSPADKPSWRGYAVLLKTPSYVLNTLGMAMMTFAIGGIGFWMPSYIHEFRGVPDLAQVNLIFGAILVVSGLTATLSGGMLADRLKERHPGAYFLVSATAMLVGMPFFILSLYAPFPWAWLCIFITCFCLFFNTGPTNAILANVTHPSIRAGAFALNIFVIHALGDVISPLVIGAVTDVTGSMSQAFLLVSLLVCLAGFIWLAGSRYLGRDSQLAIKRYEESRR